MRIMTKTVTVGSVSIGGGLPVAVQSMTNTDTRDVQATLRQLDALAEAGCDIARLAIPDAEAADAFAAIVAKSRLPLVADIHFDHRLALACIRAGAHKIRINPGNIGGADKLAAVTALARERGIPIRIGVNSGSIEKDILARHGGKPTAKGIVESALHMVKALEDLDFVDIVVSLKSSDTAMTVESYRMMSARCGYPLHVGVTEAGTIYNGIIKSSVGIGALLLDGIGDTIRVSLTADPVEEIKAGKAILKACGLLKEGVEIISCPTCGRCGIDLQRIATEVEEKLRGIKKPLKVAVMGCVVNGPGEARECDIGIAGAEGSAVLFKDGKVLRKVREEDIVAELLAEIRKGDPDIDV